ncbi:MAG: Radical domain protein, partial [Acidobacteria bacterium]|nr:Radical domain protein [Acidobacteriota bacterium]
MKICLVSSPTASEFDRRLAEYNTVRRISGEMPLGILALAAILEERGIAAEIVDLNRLYYRYLRSKCQMDFCAFAGREFKYQSFDIFGFNTICSTYPLTLRIAKEVKRSHPRARIILGGPQASVVDVPTLTAFPFIDFIVRGEADETLPFLLEDFEDRSRWGSIPGITFRNGERIIRNPDAPPVRDLDTLPMPAFHLYPDLKSCHRVPLEIGRGCPFGCTFCSTSNFFRRRFRFKSPWRVIEQMRFIRQTYGIRSFSLTHDIFTADRKQVVHFCQALLTCGERFHWTCSARTDCLDDELIRLMGRAGCEGIFLGIETGSVRLQKEISKNLDLSEAAACIRSVARNGLRTTVSLITGFPTETRKDLQQTVSFLMNAARLDSISPQLHVLAPLAGTAIYEQYRETLTLDDVFSDTSFHGWHQDPADRELIRSHPNVFPNFYAVPTVLGRRFIKELRDFIQYGLLWCRWLLVGLHQDGGDLVRVFEAWRNWLGANRRVDLGFNGDANSVPYFARREFPKDLLEFVQYVYLPSAKNPVALGALLDFELALYAAPRPCGPLQARNAPRIARGVRIARIRGDYLRILTCLREGK